MSKTLKHFFKPVCGDCSTAVPAMVGLAVQKEVDKEMDKIAKAGRKRRAYTTISEELRAKVAKYVAKNGVRASLRHFKTSRQLELKESTVRGWVTTYHKK